MSSQSRIGTPLAELFRHYHGVLGAPDGVFQMPTESGKGIDADVLIYRPAQLPFDLFITLGVSLHEQEPGEGGRVEYYSKVQKGLSEDQQKEFARSLWVLSQWPFRSAKITPLTAWHTLGGIRSLIQGSTLEGFLLKPALGVDSPIQALQKELAGPKILEAIGITIEEFIELHVSAADPQAHLATVKKFVAERIPEPHFMALLGAPARNAPGEPVTH